MFETSVSVQDCHLAMFFVDLVKDYANVLPPSISKECLYRMPALQKRTAPIDMNISRTRLDAGDQVNNWLASQHMLGKFPSPIPTPVAPVQPTPPIPDPAPNSTLRSHSLFTFALASTSGGEAQAQAQVF
jgi:hypothetical protein